MTLAQFEAVVAEHRAAGKTRMVVPIARRLSADWFTPVSAYAALRTLSGPTFLFESVEGGEHLARYSFLGADPYLILRADGAQVVAERRRAPAPADIPQGHIYDVLDSLVSAYQEVDVAGLPRLVAGAVGYMGYDTIRLIEDIPEAHPAQAGDCPDAIWCFYDTMLAFDHVRHQIVLMSSAFVDPDGDLASLYAAAQGRLDALAAHLSSFTLERPSPVPFNPEAVRSNVSRADFEAAVERAKSYVYEGDIFQVVLSQRFAFDFGGDPFTLYRAVRQVNPSPYLFFLDYGDFALAGSSPEVLVRIDDGMAEVLPIAGTRPRGRTEAEDKALEEDLLADPKERAEHLMLVDLGRNDLGRVSAYGTVAVTDYAYIERYSHVMHIVSSVQGHVREGVRPMQVLSACFPAGTVSGAPKVRAMEIIDALEPTRRGTYAGAVGYVDFGGCLDTCIAIRTMLIRDGQVFVQAGAGVVADSDPAREFEETENKARALLQAMRVASDGLL